MYIYVCIHTVYSVVVGVFKVQMRHHQECSAIRTVLISVYTSLSLCDSYLRQWQVTTSKTLAV